MHITKLITGSLLSFRRLEQKVCWLFFTPQSSSSGLRKQYSLGKKKRRQARVDKKKGGEKRGNEKQREKEKRNDIQ